MILYCWKKEKIDEPTGAVVGAVANKDEAWNVTIMIEYWNHASFVLSYFDDMIYTTFFIAYINFFLTIKDKKIVKLKYIVIICIILGIFLNILHRYTNQILQQIF